jgi:hypothetical protein
MCITTPNGSTCTMIAAPPIAVAEADEPIVVAEQHVAALR